MKFESDHLQRALRVFDPNDEGFVDYNQLRSAVRQFVMPISDFMFSQLMNKCVSIRNDNYTHLSLFIRTFP